LKTIKNQERNYYMRVKKAGVFFALLVSVLFQNAIESRESTVDKDAVVSYGLDLANTGYYRGNTAINPQNVHKLHQVWNSSFTPATYSTTGMCIENNVIYTYAATPNTFEVLLVALDANTGAQLWSVLIPQEPGDTVENIPCLGNYVYCCTQFGIVSAFNKSDGSLVWTTGPVLTNPFAQFYSSPVVLEEEHLLFLTNGNFPNMPGASGNILALDSRNGNLIWDYQTTGIFSSSTGTVTTATTTVVGTGTDFTSAMNGGVIVIYDLSTTEIFGQANVVNVVSPTELIVDKVLATESNVNYIIYYGYGTAPNAGGAGVGIFGQVAVDPKSGLLFIGTGQNFTKPASPLQDSLLALNYRTSNPQGELVWHYQYTNDDINNIAESPYDNFVKDWDAAGGPMLLTIRTKNREGDAKKGEIVAVGTKEGLFYAHDRLTGKLIWKRLLTGSTPSGSGLGGCQCLCATDGEFIYCASQYSPNGLPDGDPTYGADFINSLSTIYYKLKAADGSIVWQRNYNGNQVTPLRIANSVLYFMNVGTFDNPTKLTFAAKGKPISGILRALDTCTGELLWEYVNDIVPISPPYLSSDFTQNLAYTAPTIYKNRLYIAWGFDGPEAGVRAFGLE
jgi:outer membrane protein assembly factor BamB